MTGDSSGAVALALFVFVVLSPPLVYLEVMGLRALLRRLLR